MYAKTIELKNKTLPKEKKSRHTTHALKTFAKPTAFA